MAIAEVQVKSATSITSTGPSVAFTAPSTAGNLLVAVLTGYTTNDAVPLGLITAPAGWTLASSYIIVGAGEDRNFGVAIYYYQNAPAISAAISFTWASSLRSVLLLGEYSGLNTSGTVYDQGASTQGILGDGQTGATATTTQADELVIGGVAALANITFSAWTNSFAAAQNAVATSGSFHNVLYHVKRIVSATGSYSTSGTASITGAWYLGIVATFKANAATGTLTVSSDKMVIAGGVGLASTFPFGGVTHRPISSGVSRR